MEVAHNRIVTQFGEEVETKAVLNTASASSPLSSVAPGNIRLDQAAHLSLLIEPHFAMFSRINDTSDVWDGDSSFRDVGRFRQGSVYLKSNPDKRHHTYHNFTDTPSRDIKDSPLVFARDRRVKSVDDKPILGSEFLVLSQHVIHAANFANSGHEDKDCG